MLGIDALHHHLVAKGGPVSHRLRVVLLVLSSIAVLGGRQPVVAQEPDDVESALVAARKHLADGDRPAAISRLTAALATAPASMDLLAELLVATEDDADAFELWAQHLALLEVTDRGKAGVTRELPNALRARLEAAASVARARATALTAISRAARALRKPEDRPFAVYLLRTARVLWRDSPALRTKHERALEESVANCRSDPGDIIEYFEKQLAQAPEWRALPGYLILRGICVQAVRSKAELRNSDKTLDRAHRKVDSLRPPRVDDLKRFVHVGDLLVVPPQQHPAWSKEHASWVTPAEVASPRRRYFIQSVCGLKTTALVAALVEYQHERLVKWFGQDPFEEEPGLIRLVPSEAALESEGQMHWWVGGFQCGDLTTIRMTEESPHSIAWKRTHELTDRFDQRLHPGLPPWLLEGRAVFAEVGPPIACSLPSALDVSTSSALRGHTSSATGTWTGLNPCWRGRWTTTANSMRPVTRSGCT
jgi:hypothetical protein